VQEVFKEGIEKESGVATRRAFLNITGAIDTRFASVPVLYFKPIGMEEVITIHNSYGDSMGTDTMGDFLSTGIFLFWEGSQKENEGSASATLTADALFGDISGSIQEGNNTYTIQSVENSNGSFRYECSIVNTNDVPDETEVGSEENEIDVIIKGGFDPFSISGSGRVLSDDAQQPIDVMVVYTETAKNDTGGLNKMEADIALAVVQTNQAFSNSGSSLSIRLAKTLEDRSFPDTPESNALRALYDKDDGHFDDIDVLREEYGADIAILIASNTGKFCGATKVGRPYAVVNRFCSTLAGQYSFAHEIGHQLFAFHDRETMGTRIVKAWKYDNYGYIDKEACFRTLMSYNQCPTSCGQCSRVLHFSGERASYNGMQTGKYCDEDKRIIASQNFGGGDSVIGKAAVVPGKTPPKTPQVLVPPGYYIEVFDNYNFQGNRRVFASYSSVRNFNLEFFSISDQIYSYRIGKASTRSVKLCSKLSCSEGNYVRRQEGSFRILPREIRNKLTRVVLAPGSAITVYYGRNFSGGRKTFRNPSTTRWSNIRFSGSLGKWKNKAQSMIIFNVMQTFPSE